MKSRKLRLATTLVALAAMTLGVAQIAIANHTIDLKFYVPGDPNPVELTSPYEVMDGIVVTLRSEGGSGTVSGQHQIQWCATLEWVWNESEEVWESNFAEDGDGNLIPVESAKCDDAYVFDTENPSEEQDFPLADWTRQRGTTSNWNQAGTATVEDDFDTTGYGTVDGYAIGFRGHHGSSTSTKDLVVKVEPTGGGDEPHAACNGLLNARDRVQGGPNKGKGGQTLDDLIAEFGCED